MKDEIFKEKFEALCKEFEIEAAYVSLIARNGDVSYDPPYPPKNKFTTYHGMFTTDELQDAINRLNTEKEDGHKYVLATDAWRLLEHASNMQILLKPVLSHMLADAQALYNLEGLMKDRLGIYRSRMLPMKANTEYFVETADGNYVMSYDSEFAWSVRKVGEGVTPETIPMHGLIYMGCIVPDPDNQEIGEIAGLDGMPIVSLGCKMLWGKPQQLGQFSQLQPAWHTAPVQSLIEQFERQ